MKTTLKQLPLAAALSLGILSASAAQASIFWSYQYNNLGLVSQVDGPRSDVADLTRFEYDSRGRLIRVTNALGHNSTLSDYNAYGLPQQITDIRGVSSSLAYDGMGRLITQTLHSSDGDAITQYEYNAVGLLTKITLPNNSWLSYEYDTARRLIAVANQLGERIEFTLDSMGNRTQESVYGSSNQISVTLNNVYDEMGRLLQQVGAQSQTTAYQYDVNSNPTLSTDANLNSSGQAFDALQRLVSQTDAYNQVTQLRYDQHENVTSVTDPRNLTTEYQYDAFNRLIIRKSPDTGIIRYSYDEAGNIVEAEDARGVITQYQYDALNRITLRHFPADLTQDIAYHYDEAPQGNTSERINHTGIGLLTRVIDRMGTDHYTYDDRGNLTRHHRVMQYGDHQSEHSTEYRWNLSDSLSGITYPSGLAVNYQSNAAGQVTDVSYQYGGSASLPIATAISYQPFGDVRQLTWGNGLELMRQYDQDGRLTQQHIGDLTSLSYVYDPVGNITATDDTAQGEALFQYDVLNRLTDEQGDYGQKNYQYDEAGNRTERIWQKPLDDGSTKQRTQRLGYAEDSNRLIQRNKRSILHSATGNALAEHKNNQRYSYNLSNRYSGFYKGNILKAQYYYNGHGERVLKQRPQHKAAQLTVFHYDPAGQLLGETIYHRKGHRRVSRHYIWLDNMSVAYLELKYTKQGGLKKQQLAYLHSDHLNTPRLATNADQTPVWRWQSDAFGLGKAKLDPDGDNKKTRIALRFPGQYYDTESHLHYNYYRDYDPNTGRYIQSDPIGLAGGLNTYGYVEGNPLSYVDPDGLKPGVFNQRINQRQRNQRIRDQQLRERLQEIESSRNEKKEIAEHLVDEVEYIRKQLHEQYPMICKQWDCPWDAPDSGQSCQIPESKFEPIRGPSAGCRCKRDAPNW